MISMPLLWYAIVALLPAYPAGHGGADMLAGVAVAVAALLLIAAGRLPVRRVPGAALVGVRSAALRARARLVRLPRQLDPDAAGHPRPRAPAVLSR